nr:acyl-CoA dehydrogenase family protein [Candidatus Microthrix sp.]
MGELDRFIEAEIAPLEADNIEYFDHRREHARTDWDNGGLPRPEWEALLGETMRRADAAGHLRYALPESVGGRGGSNLDMAVIREHLATRGLGLHNDLQNETSVVGNFPFILMMLAKGTDAQRAEFIDGAFDGTHLVAFGLTEPEHGGGLHLPLDTTASATVKIG